MKRHLDGIGQDLWQGARQLRRSPGPAFVAVATLAMGIGAASAIFSVVDAVLLRDLPYAAPGRLVAVFADETRHNEPRNPTSPADFLEWRKTSRTIEHLTAARPWSAVLSGRGHAEELRGLEASPALFDLLGVPPAVGGGFDDSGSELQVVLGHGLWQRRFGGDDRIVGQSLVLDGESHVVAGVMPRGFRFPPFWATAAEMWVPLVLNPQDESNHDQSLRVFGRLRPGATVEEAQAEMDVVGRRLASEWPASNGGIGVNVEPLREPVVSHVRPALLVLTGAVVLVLLIACANVTNILLAQGVTRDREAAIRSALGASRGSLIRQRLLESVTLACAGGVAGLALAHLGVSALERLGPAGLPRLTEIAVDGRVAAFSVLLSLLAGIVAGLLPAFRSSRTDVVSSLRQGEQRAGRGGRHRLHDVLVVGEFAIAVVLLVGAGLLIKSFLLLQRPQTGFEAQGLLTMTLSLSSSPRAAAERRPAFLDELARAVGSLPGVESVAFVNHIPIGGDTWRTRFSVEGRPTPEDGEPPRAVMRTTTASYAGTMGLTLRRGRQFSHRDGGEGPPVVLVNETLARRLWPGGDPTGARIRLGRLDSGEPWRTIVGVVADSLQSSVTEPVQPEILFPYAQDPVGWYDGTTLVVRTGSGSRRLAEAIAARLRATAPEVPITRVRTMQEFLSEAIGQERFGALLLGLLAALAIALAAGGIYGVMAYAVGRRAHEIGVRMALGAPASQVQAMVLRDGLRLGVLGAVPGLLGALALSRVLRGQLHEVSPADPATFTAVGLFLLAVAALASFIPARRAARLDPAAVLREP